MHTPLIERVLRKMKEDILLNDKVPSIIHKSRRSADAAGIDSYPDLLHVDSEINRLKSDRQCVLRIPFRNYSYLPHAKGSLRYHTGQLSLYHASCAKGRD
jgi:hypothetical protein